MRKTVLLVTWNAKYTPIAEVTLPLMRVYTTRHDYELCDLPTGYHEDPADLLNYGDRGKYGHALGLFAQGYEIVCFIDVDVCVMNHAKRIEDVLGIEDFLWSFDPNGPCSGFWIARNTPAVRHLFTKVREKALELGKVMTYEKADPHGVVLQMEPHGASDQETLKAMLGIPPFSRLLWNCQAAKSVGHCYHDPARYGWHDEYTRGMVAYEPGDWLVTAPSVPLIERAAILRDYQLLAK